MQSQDRQDWNTFRFFFFWFGAVVTGAIGLFFFIGVVINGSDTPFWYAFNLVVGPLIAYVVAWVGSISVLVRVIAVFLFLAALFFTFLLGTSVLHLTGFLALIIGTPDRVGRPGPYQPAA